jgi:putative flippase GtrA
MGRVLSAAFGRYLLVGAAATAVHYAVLILLVELGGAPAAPSAAVGATAGALSAYAGNRHFTFVARATHAQALPRFLSVAVFGVVVSGAVVWAATELAGVHYLAAQAIATALVLWTGFVLNRRWTFS